MNIKCAICLDEKDSQFIYIMDTCNHKFCTACLRQYIENKIKNGETDSITCPDCKRELSIIEIKQLVDEDTFQKFEEFSVKKAISKMKNVVYCPNPLCGTPMIGDVQDSPLLICPNEKCKLRFCFNCKVSWHEGMNCEQYNKWKTSQQTVEAEEKYNQWKQENAKSCPDCGTDIQKVCTSHLVSYLLLSRMVVVIT